MGGSAARDQVARIPNFYTGPACANRSTSPLAGASKYTCQHIDGHRQYTEIKKEAEQPVECDDAPNVA